LFRIRYFNEIIERMNLMMKLITFCFLFEFLKCYKVSNDFNKRSDLIIRLENIIVHKICDESTINGVLDYNQQFLCEVEKCDQLMSLAFE